MKTKITVGIDRMKSESVGKKSTNLITGCSRGNRGL